MGSTLMEVLLEAGHDVVGFHRHETEDMLYSLEEYDLAVLSIPPPRVADEILSRERKYLGFVEVCASKSLMRKHSGRIISIHPLYGPPMSYKEPSRRNTVLVKDISVEGSLGVVKRMLPRDRIIEMGFREHDEFVLHNLAVPYAVSLLASRLLGPRPSPTGLGPHGARVHGLPCAWGEYGCCHRHAAGLRRVAHHRGCGALP
ncbi:hypothetical protein [Thermogymnomonas acidicola]|uniref:hypothetical protein n=1 Tax=Thermogymnomonas acidicola TaxID=399579 RepID=UPI0009462F59|nr:hypothetical protein [Thermogymnomonas acidicola]